MIQHFINTYQSFKEKSLFGRYITLTNIKPLVEKFDGEEVGKSVLDNPIFKLTVGTGKIKILMWSQMHGNESTTTKAVFDFLNYLKGYNKLTDEILERCTIVIIPMLNPDGAEAFTRVNANEIDLNRDAQDLSQPESLVLKAVFEEFKPDFCFNLHGQRTIFSAGNKAKSSSLSFLAPAFNENRDINDPRKAAMQIISLLNKDLQDLLPDQVGRYDDGFNDNCVGDSFQQAGASTILFEAGHIDDDYDREEIRALMTYSIFKCVHLIVNTGYETESIEDYLAIPNNEKLFYDVILRQVRVEQEGKEKSIDIAIQYREVLQNGNISFEPYVAAIDNLSAYFGHKEPKVGGMSFIQGDLRYPTLDQKAEDISLNNQLLSKLLTKK
ncbi:M14 family metallopeptidase [Spongiivirga citrea]|uniref:DUF2817 domain-containing protein n=1 Tax=Spongiivirga citrea TaxID=1481457 RepID=A0A6M0CLJ1_9FLAO|nr:M14 metallopeptidase family protein [Spongiivirga citrea]NER16719.1 DUF2817 domain-containing protein [Spongiivirga citrea]